MLLSTFLFTLMNVAVKYVPHIPAIEIILFRSVVSFFMSGVALKVQKVHPLGKNRKVLLMRGAAGSVGLILFFTILQEVPLASAVTLMFISPIFTAILGIWIVKEKVNPIQWLFFILSFLGIVVIKGFDFRISPLMALVGLGGAFFSGIAYNMIRKLKTSEHPLVVVFYFPLVTLPIAGIYSAFNWVMPKGLDWLILLAIGVLTQLAQYFMTKSYQSEELAKVAHLNFIGILYALVFGYVLFHETFNFMTYLGMTLVIVGVILNITYKSKRSQLKS